MILATASYGAEKGQRELRAMHWWERCIEHGRHIRAKREKQTERQRLVAAWAKDDGFAPGDEHVVLTKQPRLGMDVCAAMAAYGRPNDVNRSVGSWGTDEQWVYDGRRLYLYFRNGKLRSFQD